MVCSLGQVYSEKDLLINKSVLFLFFKKKIVPLMSMKKH